MTPDISDLVYADLLKFCNGNEARARALMASADAAAEKLAPEARRRLAQIDRSTS